MGVMTMPSALSRSIVVPMDLIRDPTLPSEAKYLYMVLLSHCTPGTNRCTVAQPQLLRLTGFRSAQTLRTHLERLVASGWLRVSRVRGARPTAYDLLNPRTAERQAVLARIEARLSREQFRGEALMKEWLNLLVASDEFQDNARPGFLVNPKTGERLEYDRWYPVGVAFEFNGGQHYGPTERYPDEEQVKDQQTRDLVKEALSAREGVKLVTIHATDLTLEGMRAKVEGLLPLRDLTGLEPLIEYLTTASKRYMSRASHVRRRSGRAAGERV